MCGARGNLGRSFGKRATKWLKAYEFNKFRLPFQGAAVGFACSSTRLRIPESVLVTTCRVEAVLPTWIRN